jgi:hypothetical protein
MIASMTGWNSSWPLTTAPSMTSSVSSSGFGFNHQHGVGGAGDDEVQLGLFHLVDLVGLMTYSPSM